MYTHVTIMCITLLLLQIPNMHMHTPNTCRFYKNKHKMFCMCVFSYTYTYVYHVGHSENLIWVVIVIQMSPLIEVSIVFGSPLNVAWHKISANTSVLPPFSRLIFHNFLLPQHSTILVKQIAYNSKACHSLHTSAFPLSLLASSHHKQCFLQTSIGTYCMFISTTRPQTLLSASPISIMFSLPQYV